MHVVARRVCYISSDFVDLRHWKNVDNGCILCVGCAVTHKNMPPQQKFVRYDFNKAILEQLF